MDVKLLQKVSEVIEPLIAYGGAQARDDLRLWLEQSGVAYGVAGAPDWVTPARSYLRHTLPYRDRKDLLRKTVIRMPSYRLHLDLALCRVLHAIAAGERWSRFEKLVRDVMKPIAPRILSLLEWASEHSGKPPVELSEREWQDLEAAVSTNCFEQIDQELWGAYRSPAEMFPLLEELYLPLVSQPVHAPLGGGEQQLLSRLIVAARRGDAVFFPKDQLEKGRALRQKGFPVAIRSGVNRAWLCGAVELCEPGGCPEAVNSVIEAPEGVGKYARDSEVLTASDETKHLKTNGTGQLTLFGTFVSVPVNALSWPLEMPPQVPPWNALPGRAAFEDVALPRRRSEKADEPLAVLTQHPLYGFLIQFLLAEVLDRELGDETIMLAPPLDRKVECIEAATMVLYRPTKKIVDEFKPQDRGFFELGLFDDILNQLSAVEGIHLIPLPHPSCYRGVWSYGLSLLINLEFVVGLQDRWTISPEVHDRLYGGALMRDVIRDKKQLRERFHKALTEMWKVEQKKAEAKREAVAV